MANEVHVGMGRTKNQKSVIHTGMLRVLEQTTEKGKTMRLINPERLIEDKGFFIEDDNGRMMCVVSAQDIREAQDAVIIWPVVPGHTDQYNIAEMAFHNGEERFRDKVINRLKELQNIVPIGSSQYGTLENIMKMVAYLK